MKDRSIATVNYVLPLAFCTIQFCPYRPGRVPKMVMMVSMPANGMLSQLFRRRISVLEKVVNIAQYIPVADATAGCISN